MARSTAFQKHHAQPGAFHVGAGVCLISTTRRMIPTFCPGCLNAAWQVHSFVGVYDQWAFCLACDRWLTSCQCRECREGTRGTPPPSVMLEGPFLLWGRASDDPP